MAANPSPTAPAPGREEAGAKVLSFPFPNPRPAAETVLLLGNPNVGKSLLFKNLTHRYVNVSNFPGTTVEITRARATFEGREVEVVDSPGVNDLAPRSDDARVTLQLLEQNPGATVVQVADAKNLRRALLLTLQLAELGHPMILVLNMLDELAARGGRIDMEELSKTLGIPVVGTIALRNRGTAELIEAVKDARPAVPPVARKDEDGDPYERNRWYLARVNEILAETYTITQPKNAPLHVRLGFWAMHPVKGAFFLVAVLGIVFWFVGLFGAGTLVGLLEEGVFRQRVTPLAIRAADAVLPFPHTHEEETASFTFALPITPVREVALGTFEKTVLSSKYTMAPGAPLGFGGEVLRFFHDFLVGQYGAITMALSYAFAIVLPIVTTFFLLFSILEDSGYLPRMAIMVNRTFRLMGLNGKAVLPMILGLGCDTMATMTTRILETKKERVITTMLLALAVPCSAQLGVLLAMMASLSPAAALAWVGMMIAIVLLVGSLTARAFPGDAGDFILEIPPMRRPQLANVWRKTLGRLDWYLREVIPLFLVGTGALFLLDRVGALPAIARAGEPLVQGWLGLPKEMANAFLVGFLRRDFGAVYILDAATGPNPLLSPLQIFVSMVTITLFMPCIANFLMIGKEHGMKVAWAMAAFIFPFAFFVGGVVHHIGLWLNIF
ncbi:MAG TPA: ferrous iron transporter B [Thermoanaerobaculia bacterium]|nr:ferrous iron transporter B [Thermoanaerobaculia bacterium]